MSEQTPTTALELLEALPTGARVQDKMGDIGTIHPGGIIRYPDTADLTLTYAARKYAPFTIVETTTAPPVDYATAGGYGPESLPGHSGSETSEAAARHEGVGRKTKLAHQVLRNAMHVGLTAKELGAYFNWSHGAASGALSRLHRAGLILRTTEKRHRQLVYVDPQHLNGREESPYTPNAAYRENRQPMPLERPEPTLETITQDIEAGWGVNAVTATLYAPSVLEIVRRYR